MEGPREVDVDAFQCPEEVMESLEDLQYKIEELQVYCEEFAKKNQELQHVLLMKEREYKQAVRKSNEDMAKLRSVKVHIARENVMKECSVTPRWFNALTKTVNQEKIISDLTHKVDELDLKLMEKDGLISSMEWKIKDAEATITVLSADRNRLAVEVDEMALRLEELEYAENLHRHTSTKQQVEKMSRDSSEDEMDSSSDTVTRINSQDSFLDSDDDKTESYGSLKRAANFSNINNLDESADFQLEAPSILDDSSRSLSTDAMIETTKESPATFDNNGNYIESFEEPRAGQTSMHEIESMDITMEKEPENSDDGCNEKAVGCEEIVGTTEIVGTEEIVGQVFGSEVIVDDDQILDDDKSVHEVHILRDEILDDEEQAFGNVNDIGVKEVIDEKGTLDDETSIGADQVSGYEETVDDRKVLVNDDVEGEKQTIFNEKSVDERQFFDGEKAIDKGLVFDSREGVDGKVVVNEKQVFAIENSTNQEQVFGDKNTIGERQNIEEECPVKLNAPKDMGWEKFDRSDGAADLAALRKKSGSNRSTSNFEESSNQAELTPFLKDAKKSLFMQIVESIPDSSVDESPAKSPELLLSTTQIPTSQDPWNSPLQSPKPEEKPRKFSRNLFWEKNSDCNRYPFYSPNAEEEDTLSKNHPAPFEMASTPSRTDPNLQRDYFASENEGAPRSGTLSPIGSQRSGILSPVGSQRSGALSPIGSQQSGTLSPIGSQRSGILSPVGSQRSGALSPIGSQQSGTLSPIGSQRSGILSPVGSQRSGALSPIGSQQSGTLSPIGSQRSGILSPVGSQRSGALSPIGSQQSGTLSPIGRDIFENGIEEYQRFQPFAEEIAISESKAAPKEFSFDEKSFSFEEVNKEPVKVVVNKTSREKLFDFEPDSIVDVSTGQTIYESRQSDEETSSIPHSPKLKHNEATHNSTDVKPIIDEKYLTSKLNTDEEEDHVTEARIDEDEERLAEMRQNKKKNHSHKAGHMNERDQSLEANHSDGNVSANEQHSQESGLSDGSITPKHEREVSFTSTNSSITPQDERGTSFSGSNSSPERKRDSNRSRDYRKKGLLESENQQFVRKGSRKEREALNAYMQWKLNGKQGDPPVNFKISLC